MKDYLLAYHSDFSAMPQRTPEQIQANTQKWMDWISSLAAADKLVSRGNRLEATGRVVKNSTVVTNGPYAEIKESLGGYSIIKAATYEEAVELVKDCPIYAVGGSVEIREIGLM